MPRFLVLSTLVLAVIQAPSPQSVVDELLATDRAFSAAAAKHNVIGALSAMFADDVIVVVPPPGDFARGKTMAADALATNPDNPKGRVEWAPLRGGVSADGQHGFTVGYMTLHRADNTRVPIKYVAYWIKKPEGWRVAVYKRARSGEGTPNRDLLPPALPSRIVSPSANAAAITGYKTSLDQAERAFSDEAQKIGLGAAFAKHGAADALNVGPNTEANFVRGSEAIGRAVGTGEPTTGSSVSWAPVDVIVASSGDLGVTYGLIKQNAPTAADRPAAIPFITIWRRASAKDPWRYVAE